MEDDGYCLERMKVQFLEKIEAEITQKERINISTRVLQTYLAIAEEKLRTTPPLKANERTAHAFETDSWEEIREEITLELFRRQVLDELSKIE